VEKQVVVVATPKPAEAMGMVKPQGTLIVAGLALGAENWIQRFHQGDEIFIQVAEPLLRTDTATRAPIPGLVEEWEVTTEGGRITWSFRLREGTQFHGGWGELTSDDVKWSISEMFKDDTVHPGVRPYKAAIGDDINNVEIVDRYNFKFHSSKPVPDLIWFLGETATPIWIESKAWYDKVGDEGASKEIIGTGSWRFSEHVRGQKVVLEAVPDHWRKTPEFETNIYLKVPEESTRLSMVRAGQADITTVSFSLLKEAKASGVRLKSIKSTGSTNLSLGGHYPGYPKEDPKWDQFWPGHQPDLPWWQLNTAPEKGLKIRQALSLAIDRQTIVDKLLLGEGEVAQVAMAIVPGPYLFNRPEWPYPQYDPEMAKQLLAEGGYPDGFEIPFYSFNTSGRPYQIDLGEAVAGYWEDIGIKVNRTITEYRPTVRTKFEHRTTDGALLFTTSFRDEPLLYMRVLFTPKGSVAYFHHPFISEMVDKLSNESRLERRMEMSREVGDWLLETQLILPTWTVNSVFALSDQIGEWPTIASSQYIQRTEYITHKK